MSRILILANDYTTVYYFRRELIERLISEHHEIHISLPKIPQNCHCEDMGCRVHDIRITRTGTNPISELRLVCAYIAQIRSLKPDVVLTYTAKPNTYGGIACQHLRIPYISNVTGLGSVIHGRSLLRPVLIALQRQAYRASSCVFFQNAGDESLFVRKGIVRTRHRLLPGSGVNLKLHRFEAYPQDTERTKFIVISRIRRDKGFNELLSSMRATCDSRVDVEFHIVGWYEDEEYRAQLESLSASYPIWLHGRKSPAEVHELISSCHALVHASHHEGMSNVLLEAGATGRPCIASDICGCREAVDNGTTGYTFEVKSEVELFSAIKRFLDLPYEQKRAMGIAARRKIEREFDRDLVVEAYMEELYAITH